MPGRGEGRGAQTALPWLAAALALLAAACAPKPLTLPGGPAVPLADASPITAALEHCSASQTLAAEIGLSGRAAGQRLRGTLHAGFAPPNALRLEAVAPFGGPVFVLAGRDEEATLLLAREDRVVRAAPAAILEALVGLRVAPASLAAWVSGCPSVRGAVGNPRRVGDGWLAADIDTHTLWLQRRAEGAVLAAEVHGALTVEFLDSRGRGPSRLRLRQQGGAGTAPLDIRLALDQVERGVALAPSAFTVDVPETATPLTIDELREAGPLSDVRPPS